MADTQFERPRFYEQQFLDSADLTAIVEFARLAKARHDLASHTWGIAAGLQLAEAESASGLDVYIQPGYAIDGFGRPVVLTEPYRLPADLFKNIQYDPSLDGGTPEGRGVPVWIEYYEAPKGGPSNGFQVCSSDDQYDRVEQSFRVHVGDKPTIEQQRDPVNIGGREVDAARALQAWGNGTEPLIEDASVSYQSFPEPTENPLWLIPLGVVRWCPNQNATVSGKFVSRVDADLEWSDRTRRYSGVVAETVNAARGFIRFRNRFESEAPSVWSDDLVWCEGSLRVSGDLKVLGGQISLRDSFNGDSATPLGFKRIESNGLPSPNTGKDLAVQIGTKDDGNTRFVVGCVKDGDVTSSPSLVVRDNGTVGIGVDVPTAPLTIKGQGDNGSAVLLQDQDGRESWYISQAAAGVQGLNIGEGSGTDGRFFIEKGGNVGINNAEPTNQLDVRGNTGIRQNRLYLSGGDKGAYGWCSISYNAHHRANNASWNFPDSSRNAVSIELDDDGGTPKFEVKSTTPSNKTQLVRRFYINGTSGNAELSGALSLAGGLSAEGAISTQSNANVSGAFRVDGSASIGQAVSVGGMANIAGSATVGGTANIGGNTTVGGTLRANGRLSAGNVAPVANLHVQASISADAGSPANHVAFLDNVSTGSSADVLALRVGIAKPTAGSNYVTCIAAGTAIGAIEGNGSGGIRLNTTGADYAEYLPKLDPSEIFEAGDIVGVFAGRISRKTTGADHILVVSTAAIVLGNRPSSNDTSGYEEVAMLGQVPAKVYGAVNPGDIIISDCENPAIPAGCGIAISPDRFELKHLGNVVGVAWNGLDTEVGTSSMSESRLVNISIGLPMNRLWGMIASKMI